MKVRIKKTGEVLEVAEYAKVAMVVCDSYGNPLEYGLNEIEIIEDVNRNPDIYWRQVETQAAIGAMQVMLTRGVPASLQYQYTKEADNHKVIAHEAVLYARELVEELKKDVNI